MSTDSHESLAKFYAALSNPTRRKIVQILRENDRLGFKEIHDTLKISVGALYHHLDMLEGIVAQDLNRKYLLTDQGRSVIETLSVSEEKIAVSSTQLRPEHKFGFWSKEILLGRTLFNYLNEESWRSFPIALLIVAFGSWISSQTRLEPLLLFYVTPATGLSTTWFFLLFPVGWLATFLVADILSMVLYHRSGDDLRLLNATAFAMTPLLIVPIIITIAQAIFPSASFGYLLILLSILVQGWVVCLLASAISISKGLRLERAALLSLGVVYLNILVLVAGLQLGIL